MGTGALGTGARIGDCVCRYLSVYVCEWLCNRYTIWSCMALYVYRRTVHEQPHHVVPEYNFMFTTFLSNIDSQADTLGATGCLANGTTRSSENRETLLSVSKYSNTMPLNAVASHSSGNTKTLFMLLNIATRCH